MYRTNQFLNLFIQNKYFPCGVIPQLVQIENSIQSNFTYLQEQYKWVLHDLINPLDFKNHNNNNQFSSHKVYYNFVKDNLDLFSVSKMNPIEHLYYRTNSEQKPINTLWENLIKQYYSQLQFKQKITHIFGKNIMLTKEQLSNMVINYYMFLDMCNRNKDTMIIPTIQEDFIWHSHLLDHNNYMKDTTSIFGKPLNHIIDEDKVENNRVISFEIRQNYYKNLYGDLFGNDSYNFKNIIDNNEDIRVQKNTIGDKGKYIAGIDATSTSNLTLASITAAASAYILTSSSNRSNSNNRSNSSSSAGCASAGAAAGSSCGGGGGSGCGGGCGGG